MSEMKFLCSECKRTTTYYRVATHPLDDSKTLIFCPHCLEPNSLIAACETDGCEKPASAGTPTDQGGYSFTCGDHAPEPAEMRYENQPT